MITKADMQPLTRDQIMRHYLAECRGDLASAYAMSCEQVRIELTSGINRTMNQSTRDIQIKGEKTIEGEGVSIMNIEQTAE